MSDTPSDRGARNSGQPTAWETGVAHLRELMEIKDQQRSKELAELWERNRWQDQEQARLAKELTDEIKAIRELLWSGLKWLGGLTGGTLLSVMLKQLGLL